MRARKSDLRCVTLNLEGLTHDWMGRRAKVVAKGLRSYAPDVVCLQETTVRYGAGIYEQAGELANAIGLPYSLFSPYGNPIEVMSFDQGGIAILSRWPILHARNRRLPGGHDHPPDSRVAIIAEIDAPFGELRVINTHLSWRPEESPIRLVQVGLIMDDLILEGAIGNHARTILAGDFNAFESEPAIQLANEHLIDSYRECHPHENGHTVVKTNPYVAKAYRNFSSRRLDYIFCSKAAEVKRAEVILNRPGTPYPSDHFGVMADVNW